MALRTPQHAAAADLHRILGGDQGAVAAARLLRPITDRQRTAAIGAGIAARTERQARHDPRRVVVGRQQMPPPRVGVAVLRHRQHADRDAPLGDGADHLKARLIGGHRGLAAVMVARQVPDAGRLGRRVDPRRERALQPHRRRQQLAPDAHQGAGGNVAASPLDQAAQNLRLARRLIGRDAAGALLRRHPGDDLQALDQQILQAVVNPIEATAQFFEIGLGRQHGFDRFSEGPIVVERGLGESKENSTRQPRKCLAPALRRTRQFGREDALSTGGWPAPL